MFSHAMKPSQRVRSSIMTQVLTAILALEACLALPPGHARAQSSTSRTPPASGIVSLGVGPVSYDNKLYTFVVGKDGDLWVDIWNGSSWQWSDLGTPA